MHKNSFTIQKQGAIIVNSVTIDRSGKNVCTLLIDLKNKHADMDFHSEDDDGAPVLYFDQNEDTTATNGNPEITALKLDYFKGWTVFACNVRRYTARVCLTKNKE